MKIDPLYWQIYEVTAKTAAFNGVQLRGRTRKFAVEQGINALIENTEDITNAVRFAVLDKSDADTITEYIDSITDDAVVMLVRENVPNPVLSKITVNNLDKYTL